MSGHRCVWRFGLALWLRWVYLSGVGSTEEATRRPPDRENQMGMTYEEALEAAKKSGGKVVVLTYWTKPTTEKERARRVASASMRQAEHKALGRVKTEAVAESGSVLVRVAGAINRDEHALGVYLTKKGEPSLSLVISAPTEYGYTTACLYAGKAGSACENRRPFHAHRGVNLTRLVSWLIAGEEQVKMEPQLGC